MPTDVPAVLTGEPVETGIEAQTATSEWIEIAFAVLFAAGAVLLVSFIAVVTGLM
jgi:hypothetical protein